MEKQEGGKRWMVEISEKGATLTERWRERKGRNWKMNESGPDKNSCF